MTGDVFLVDDNLSNLALLGEILRRAGFQVRAAQDGKQALSMIREHPPDLVMLDIMMPGMDGYGVCRELKEDEATREIPVIFISALDEPVDKVKAFSIGGGDYVTKPFHAKEVVVRVENQLKISRLQREAESKNAELQKAYEQIARLSQRSTGQLEDTPAWAAAMASEVAQAIGAREIGIWLLEENLVTPLVPGGTTRPDASRLRRPGGDVEFIAPDGSTVVPVTGMTGVTYGALVISAPSSLRGETQRRLISGLAHHLGTALELRSLRGQLSASQAIQAASRRAMHDRGTETLLVCPLCGHCFPDTAGTDTTTAPTCSEDGAILDASRILPFRVLGRYRFEMLIGEGGMGTVFSAHDETLERDVALKIIKSQHLSNPTMRHRLTQEAKLVARIQHPGVTALFDSGELEDGSAYLVMELLKGRGLAGILSDFGAGTPRQVARLLRQAGAALTAAHRAEIIHRDIKPDNIYLVPGSDGFQAKLLDFGIALSAHSDERVTQAGVLIGTPAYMSPEQVQGKYLDEGTDIYSLACVTWEALVGRRMVRGKQIAEVLLNLISDAVVPVSRHLSWAPQAVDELFESALAKSRLSRPRDVESWATALATLLEGYESDVPGWPSQAWMGGAPSASSAEDMQATTIGSDPLARKAKVKKGE